MEELLVIVLQIVGEVLLQFLCYLPFDLPFTGRNSRGERVLAGSLLFLAVGCILGWISLLFLPHVVFPYPWLRLVNLLLSPALCGWAAWLVTKWRQRWNKLVEPGAHFVFAAVFAFGYAAVRFATAAR